MIAFTLVFGVAALMAAITAFVGDTSRGVNNLLVATSRAVSRHETHLNIAELSADLGYVFESVAAHAHQPTPATICGWTATIPSLNSFGERIESGKKRTTAGRECSQLSTDCNISFTTQLVGTCDGAEQNIISTTSMTVHKTSIAKTRIFKQERLLTLKQLASIGAPSSNVFHRTLVERQMEADAVKAAAEKAAIGMPPLTESDKVAAKMKRDVENFMQLASCDRGYSKARNKCIKTACVDSSSFK